MPNTKVLLVAPYYPPHAGGLERYVQEIAGALKEQDQDVVVVTTGEGTRVEHALEQGVSVYRLPVQFKFSNTPFSFGWARMIRKIAHEERPDVVNVHMPVPGIGDIAALTLRRVPLVVTYHALSMKKGNWTDSLIALYESLVLPVLLRRARHIICSSEAVRNGFLARYQEKSSTIEPAVNADFFSPSSAGGNLGKPRIVFVSASLTKSYEHKGLSRLLAACSVLEKEGVAYALDIVGAGDLAEGYEKQARDAGIDVTMHGRLAGEELREVYRGAAVSVSPTSNDSFPISILEALACGVPVVSTRIGDIPRMIEDGVTGFVVEVQDQDTLVQRMQLLLTDTALRQRMGTAARERALHEYSWQERAERTLAVCTVVRQQHIVHIAAYYPPHVGGVERVVQGIAERLQDSTYVTVVTSGGGRSKSARNLCVKRLASLEFAHTPFAPVLFFHLLLLTRPTLFHVHLAQAYWPEIVRLVAWIRRVPLVVHFHLDVQPSGPLGGAFRAYKYLTWGPLLRRARLVITCSREQKNHICARYRIAPERVAVIGNAVGEDFFAGARSAPATPIRILAIGRLTNQKRFDRIIDACALLRIPYTLTIAGDGEDRELLETHARECAVPAIFTGTQNDIQMQELHRTHDLLAISSDREGGTPLVVLEAAAAGLPVIGTDTEGVRDMVRHFGVIATAPYAEHIAEAITHLASDHAAYAAFSEQGIAVAREHTWSAYLDTLRAIYARITI